MDSRIIITTTTETLIIIIAGITSTAMEAYMRGKILPCVFCRDMDVVHRCFQQCNT